MERQQFSSEEEAVEILTNLIYSLKKSSTLNYVTLSKLKERYQSVYGISFSTRYGKSFEEVLKNHAKDFAVHKGEDDTKTTVALVIDSFWDSGRGGGGGSSLTRAASAPKIGVAKKKGRKGSLFGMFKKKKNEGNGKPGTVPTAKDFFAGIKKKDGKLMDIFEYNRMRRDREKELEKEVEAEVARLEKRKLAKKEKKKPKKRKGLFFLTSMRENPDLMGDIQFSRAAIQEHKEEPTPAPQEEPVPEPTISEEKRETEPIVSDLDRQLLAELGDLEDLDVVEYSFGNVPVLSPDAMTKTTNIGGGQNIMIPDQYVNEEDLMSGNLESILGAGVEPKEEKKKKKKKKRYCENMDEEIRMCLIDHYIPLPIIHNEKQAKRICSFLKKTNGHHHSTKKKGSLHSFNMDEFSAPPLSQLDEQIRESKKNVSHISGFSQYEEEMDLDSVLAVSDLEKVPVSLLLKLKKMINEELCIRNESFEQNEDGEDELCIVCFDKPRKMMYQCGHVLCCEDCGKVDKVDQELVITNCPVCKKRIIRRTIMMYS